ncbi:hypothetical protein C8E86_7291 [Catellatospora citrea]|nr:hypothetical protein C8E86_7291 [Catellatospora citrea]
MVSVNDYVALDLEPNTLGKIVGAHPTTGMPKVTIVEGAGVGGVVYPYPGQMLRRVHAQ